MPLFGKSTKDSVNDGIVLKLNKLLYCGLNELLPAQFITVEKNHIFLVLLPFQIVIRIPKQRRR